MEPDGFFASVAAKSWISYPICAGVFHGPGPYDCLPRDESRIETPLFPPSGSQYSTCRSNSSNSSLVYSHDCGLTQCWYCLASTGNGTPIGVFPEGCGRCPTSVPSLSTVQMPS